MTFFQSLNPANTPPALQKQDRITVWRDQILQTLLLGSTIIGLAALITVALLMPAVRTSNLLLLITLFLVELIMISCLRAAPYHFRVGGFLTPNVILVVFTYLAGNLILSAVFFIALVLFSSILLSSRQATILLPIWIVVAGGIVTVHSLTSSIPVTPGFIASGVVFLIIVLMINAVVMFFAKKVSESAVAEHQAKQTLERERGAMENRIQEELRPYIARLVAARAAAEISSHISAIRDPEELLKQVIDLMKKRFKLYYIGVFVVDSSGRYAILKAGTGEAGEQMIAQGHRLSIGDTSMIGWAIKHKEPRISQNIKFEAVRFNNPFLPDTHSELALPIVARGASLGAMTIQSEEENAFDEDDILIFTGIAGSLAAALENARLDRQIQEAHAEVRALNRNYLQKAWAGAEWANLSHTHENHSSADKAGIALHKFPLILREHTIGEMTIESDQADLSPEETALIEAITAQTAIALESARLLEETQQRAYEEQKLNDLSEQFSQAVNINDILRIAVKELGALPSATDVSIHLLTPGSELAHQHNGNGHNPERL